MSTLFSDARKVRQARSNAPRVSVGMMERDEDNRLEAWILYHAYLFGFENLYVYDNGSSSPHVRAILDKYARQGVHVDYAHDQPHHFDSKGAILLEKFKRLEADGGNQFFVPLDCDEFFALRGADGLPTADPAMIHAYLAALENRRETLVALNCYSNILGYAGHFFPPFPHHKVFFKGSCCEWMDPGFHSARWREPRGEHATEIVYLHFHFRPYAEMLAHSRLKLAHLVDVSNPNQLLAFDGSGRHVVEYLLSDQAKYESRFENVGGVYLSWLVTLLEDLGARPNFFVSI